MAVRVERLELRVELSSLDKVRPVPLWRLELSVWLWGAGFRVERPGFRVRGYGSVFRVKALGVGFRVQGSGYGSGFRVKALGVGFGVQGSGFRVHGSGFMVDGSGFRVMVQCFV